MDYLASAAPLIYSAPCASSHCITRLNPSPVLLLLFAAGSASDLWAARRDVEADPDFLWDEGLAPWAPEDDLPPEHRAPPPPPEPPLAPAPPDDGDGATG